MALRQSVEFKGIQIPYAYIKVVTPQIQHGNDGVEFRVNYMSSKGAETFMTKTFECSYSMDGVNPIKQGYEHIKTLEEFAGSEDC